MSIAPPADLFIATLKTQISSAADEEKKRGEDQVHKHDEKDGHDHRSGCGAADLFCPGARGKALEAAHSSNGNAKHHAFNQARNDVAEEQRVHGDLNVTAEREVGLGNAEE